MVLTSDPSKLGDLCKTLLFARFQCQTQISILEILNVCLGLKSSPSLNLNKDEHFSKVSLDIRFAPTPKTGVFSLFQ